MFSLPTTITTGFLKNAGWMILSEGMARASRLITVIAMAALLSSTEFGIAVLAMACHEIFRVLMRTGAGQRVIQSTDAELVDLAPSAISVQWILLIFISLIQWLSADLIGKFYSSELLAELLKLMAISYLFYPLVSMRVFLLQRTNQIKYFSMASAIAVLSENLSCALLLVLGVGIYAVAWAKIIAAVVWIIAFSRADVARYSIGFNPEKVIELFRFSRNLLGTEAMKTLRSQIDLIIAGKLLSPELFGIYSFAKNAGVGFGQSLISAYTSVLYPHICQLIRDNQSQQQHKSVFKITASVSVLFIAQSLCAPLYINFLFEEKWHECGYLVSLLCLVAVPSIFIDTECCILRAQRHLYKEFVTITFTLLVSVFAIVLVNPSTPSEFAVTVLISSLTWVVIFYEKFQYQINDHLKRVIS